MKGILPLFFLYNFIYKTYWLFIKYLVQYMYRKEEDWNEKEKEKKTTKEKN